MNKASWPGNWRSWTKAERELSPFSQNQAPFLANYGADEDAARHGLSLVVGMPPGRGLSLPYQPKKEWEGGIEGYAELGEWMAQPEALD